MIGAFLCDGIRTPIGRYGGALATIRTDDLAALPIRTLLARNPGLDPAQIDDVLLGCANQAGEDNRNVARMAALLAGLPVEVPGMTINRLCGSGLEALGTAARAIMAGEAQLLIAGGVESMSRAPYVMGKAGAGFARGQALEDTTMGWRLVNPAMRTMHGVDSMPQTAETVAKSFGISREDQDRFALRSQQNAAAAADFHAGEIMPVVVTDRESRTVSVSRDEHPRMTDLAALARLKPVTGQDGTVTAGNSSGINDGAAALLVASEAAAAASGLSPRARILGMASAGVAPRVMGIGPVAATQKLLGRLGLGINDFDVIELNEAFAAQGLAVLRELGLPDDAPQVNAHGGAIALGHPLGMSGARLGLTALRALEAKGGKRALVTMCVGVGQGITLALESV